MKKYVVVKSIVVLVSENENEAYKLSYKLKKEMEKNNQKGSVWVDYVEEKED